MKKVTDKIQAVSKSVEDAVYTTDRLMQPVRHSIFNRFPIVFIILVTFGVGATFFGIERIIASISWFDDKPYVIFCLGLAILTFTGKVYQKLG